ncbi:hypothetical protein MHY1_p00084 (plasmid) [Methylovirgula sp. HY1]|nr:hypothetical protein MHY1_p00084 [Methylovirgula sp. HY1]
MLDRLGQIGLCFEHATAQGLSFHKPAYVAGALAHPRDLFRHRRHSQSLVRRDSLATAHYSPKGYVSEPPMPGAPAKGVTAWVSSNQT